MGNKTPTFMLLQGLRQFLQAPNWSKLFELLCQVQGQGLESSTGGKRCIWDSPTNELIPSLLQTKWDLASRGRFQRSNNKEEMVSKDFTFELQKGKTQNKYRQGAHLHEVPWAIFSSRKQSHRPQK